MKSPSTDPVGPTLEIPQHDSADHDFVTIAQVALLDALAIDERAVEATVIENAVAGGPRDKDCVTSRNGDIVEMQVGPKAATDVGDLGAERDQQRSTGSLDLDVAAWLKRLIGLDAVAETLVKAGDGIETLGYLINSGANEYL